MITPALLQGRDRYERRMEGWVDNTHPDAFTHTVRLDDPDRAIEVTIVALPSPTYEIREARGRALRGALGPVATRGVAALAGTRMVGGLTRRAVEATGGDAGAGLVVDAVIEIARLARQVAKLPRARAERAAGGDPWECWQLDTTGWIDLPNSCFAYSDAGRALFGTRTIATPMRPDLYSPRPGQRRVFERRKVARLERAADRLRCFHSMHDDVHGFELTYEIDLASARIVRAEHVTPKLPYMGVCSEPQRRMATMLGETVDAGLRQRIQTHMGGQGGCAQLYDLTADLLKLLT
ncbi:MAG: hypothetical protein A3F92_11845 [Candidatus Rokubacteria bacterium RIFCSPLOWO2_12_FULL_71_22]|nr:MAG: hypothetical protein A3I17_09585 [Candidatus Rokubacteria bacterium RIFCSPLOWO2_02_FULL_72_37]OGL19417.1 MAG: hypothetical protein A3F92_11845 [Candidatus Rokubacteria bacterium RIFCSPLOWO2_12_FULL_71_22]